MKHPALELADWCEAHSSGVYRPSAEAAAELRRQHALIVQMREALDGVVPCLEDYQRGPSSEEAEDALTAANDYLGESGVGISKTETPIDARIEK